MGDFHEFYCFHFTFLFYIFCLKMELFGSAFQLWSMLAEQNWSLGPIGCTEFASAYWKFCIVCFFMHIFKCPRCSISGKSRVPLQAWGGPQGSRKLKSSDFLTTAQDGGKVFSLSHRPHLPPGNTPGTQFCWRLSRPHSAIEGFMPTKNSMTPSGIEPATFWFVAQYHNHCATSVPV
jgi:hypothetical protein